MGVADNLARIRESIGAQPVKIIAVTKYTGPEGIEEAFDCGVTEFGENRVQDLVRKHGQLPERLRTQINWHFIGHLQTNKVKQVVGQCTLIHSVDSLHLAQAVSREAARRSVTQPVLLQVKVISDPGKFGFTQEELKADLGTILALPNIEVKGLMTITPLTGDPAVRQQCFEGLKALRDELEKTHGIALAELSMGMTDDWPEAIRCGATMVRLGRAIFGS
jgi:hypothetical protein